MGNSVGDSIFVALLGIVMILPGLLALPEHPISLGRDSG